jgi:hypothetical protein
MLEAGPALQSRPPKAADGILLLRDLYHTLESRSAPDLCAVDCPLGNSVGAIGWPEGPVVASLQGPAGWGFTSFQ